MSADAKAATLFDTDTAAELEELRDNHAALNREYTALHDRYMRLLTQRERWSERVRSAARRTAIEHVVAFAHLHLQQALAGAGGSMWFSTLRLAQELPDRPSPEQVRALRTAAENADHLRKLSQDQAKAEQFYADQRAEERRLRDRVVTHARAIHERHGVPTRIAAGPGGEPCECAGCALIIGMDLVADVAEPAPDGEPAERWSAS